MNRLIRAGLAALALTAATAATAFTFQPMFVRLDAAGPGNVQTFEVSNEGDESLAVRFSVYARSTGPDGAERNEDASALFTVYPARLVVEARSGAAVKVQWNGGTVLPEELAFRLVAENVALDSGGPATSGIKVMFRYVASLYVGDADFSPDLVVSVKGDKGDKGKRGFMVEIANRGRRHVVAESASLTIKGVKGAKDGIVTIGSAELGILSGANYLPGYPIRLFIPYGGAAPGRSYDAQIEYQLEY